MRRLDRTQILILVAASLLLALSFALGGSQPPAQGPGASTPSTAATEREPSRGDQPGPGVESASQATMPPSDTPPSERLPQATTTLANDSVTLSVTNAGPALSSVVLEKFARTKREASGPIDLVTTPPGRGTLAMSFAALGGDDVRFERLSSSGRSVTHRATRGGVEVIHELSLDTAGYGGELRVRVRNRGDRPVSPRLEATLTATEASDVQDHVFQNYQLSTLVDGGVERALVGQLEVGGFFSGPSPTRERFAGNVEWIAAESQYFMLAVIPDAPRDHSATWASDGPRTGHVSLEYPLTPNKGEIPPGLEIQRVYRLYFGPKLAEEIARADAAELKPALAVGWAWVQPIVDVFAKLLVWTHENVIANYGVAIILLTVLLRLVTYPLTQSSMKSMRKMATIGPQMKELQEKFAGDNQRLQEEMLRLYRESGVNPAAAMAGGCLPMLLQMPFMIALYFALQGTIELRHAPFVLWIDDLSAPENFLTMAGVPIRPLPLLMGGSMVLQQWLTPVTGGAQAAQQRQMMMIMSVMFTFFFYQFPSGLVLYWLVSNLLGIGQQILVNRQPATKT
jgi:YidC/Oxa1 family membrane protein insertase